MPHAVNDSEIAAGFAAINTTLKAVRGDIRELQDHVKVTNGTVAALKEAQIRADERHRMARENALETAQVAATEAAKASVKSAKLAPKVVVFNAAIGLSGVGAGALLNHLLG